MEVRDAALLKKCLKDGGTSLPFLQKQKENKNKIMTLHRVNMGYNVTNFIKRISNAEDIHDNITILLL